MSVNVQLTIYYHSRVNKRTKAVRVIGIVRKSITFTKLADFQLQYPAPPPTPNYCNVVSPLVDYRYITRDKHAIRVNAKCHSLRDTPFDYFYQNGDAGTSLEFARLEFVGQVT